MATQQGWWMPNTGGSPATMPHSNLTTTRQYNNTMQNFNRCNLRRAGCFLQKAPPVNLHTVYTYVVCICTQYTHSHAYTQTISDSLFVLTDIADTISSWRLSRITPRNSSASSCRPCWNTDTQVFIIAVQNTVCMYICTWVLVGTETCP